jgi:hypothetical protein
VSGPIDYEELMDQLAQAIGDWEVSPYYLPEKELFDLERFLVDHQAFDLKKELERIHGTPLNEKFWSSSLAYQRLKRAREEVKAQEVVQDEKRRRYLQAVEEGKKEWGEWIKEWTHNQRRQQMKVLPGGKKDKPPK